MIDSEPDLQLKLRLPGIEGIGSKGSEIVVGELADTHGQSAYRQVGSVALTIDPKATMAQCVSKLTAIHYFVVAVLVMT